MYDEEIIQSLYNAYGGKIKKVSSRNNSTISVKRKKRIGIRKKILGIFPIYDYEVGYETLSHWSHREIVIRNNFTGNIVYKRMIAICYDSKGKTCYWKYA